MNYLIDHDKTLPIMTIAITDGWCIGIVLAYFMMHYQLL